MKILLLFLLFVYLASSEVIANNRIDTQRPDAPILAAYGKYKVGVRSLQFTITNQINVVNIQASSSVEKLPHYDRPLALEVWYPALDNATGNTTINAYIRDGKKQVKLIGRAMRNAQVSDASKPFPLVIISHGYPGNRFLLAHLAENIASKGYVVVSIDHTDSTYRTMADFRSTLLNRTVDQESTLDFIRTLANDENAFLFNIVDTNNAALIGYSMGAYGALITAGAGINPALVGSPLAPPHKLLERYTSKNKQQQNRPRKAFKTIIAFAPWGKTQQMWTTQSLADITLPTLLIAGSKDDVSGYENGVRAIWQQMTGATRALLTYENANHSAGAPIPAPKESFVYDSDLGIHLSDHYTDPVWDSLRMNNISQHFVSAWLAKHLQHDEKADQYLTLIPISHKGVWAMDEDGLPLEQHTYWKGFKKRTAVGLRFEVLSPE